MTLLRNRFIAFLALLAWAGTASGIPMLDQENDATGGGANGFVGGLPLDRGQTFTVGKTGLLTGIDVQIRREANTTQDLFWDLRTLNGTAPSDANAGPNILASGNVAALDVGLVDDGFVSLGAVNVNVTIGDMLAIVLRSDDPTTGAYRWRSITDVDSYAGGAMHDRFPSFSNIWEEETSVFLDGGFRTFVDDGVIVQPTPNPATIALFGLALTALGWSRRKQQA